MGWLISTVLLAEIVFQAVSTWNVGFEFDQDVVFQAWNGDIAKHTKSGPISESKSKSDLISQSTVHPDQQVLQWSALPLPVLANWLSSEVPKVQSPKILL